MYIFACVKKGLLFLTPTYTLAQLHNGHAAGMSCFTDYKPQQNLYLVFFFFSIILFCSQIQLAVS